MISTFQQILDFILIGKNVLLLLLAIMISIGYLFCLYWVAQYLKQRNAKRFEPFHPWHRRYRSAPDLSSV